ncbi:hypothetical protein AB0F13_26590 [Streptomyces sp. NPDC026206]|uniref:hypothetical protein n=1 Tax=Streptomyces sp. NPDC026206 TaxID=3157089 RepID=UPI0034053BAA
MVRSDVPGHRRPRRPRRPRPVGRVVALVAGGLVGGLWCWAVFRLLTQPGRTGFLEGLVATGGWGLSLLPVHCVPRDRGTDARGARRSRWRRAR